MQSTKKYLLDDSSDQQELATKLLNQEQTSFEHKAIENITGNGSSENSALLQKRNNHLNQKNSAPIFANISNLLDKEKKLAQLWGISLTYFVFGILEIIGGYYANSIAIMSDAAHSFSDCFCFLIYILSIYATRKGTSTSMSYGYHRGEIIGTLVSVTIIYGLSFWLLYTAFSRLIVPKPVNGLIMFLVAIAALIFNLLMSGVLMYGGVGHNSSFEWNKEDQETCSDHNHSSNELSCSSVRGTFRHALGDSLQNCTIIIAGVVIYFFPQWTVADPVCTFIFTFLVLYTAYQTLYTCITILMEGAPIEFDCDTLGNDLLNIKGVVEVHDLHVWSLSLGKISMSCHLTSTTPQVSLKKAREMLKRKYNITHSTIQVELDSEKLNHSCMHDLHK